MSCTCADSRGLFDCDDCLVIALQKIRGYPRKAWLVQIHAQDVERYERIIKKMKRGQV